MFRKSLFVVLTVTLLFGTSCQKPSSEARQPAEPEPIATYRRHVSELTGFKKTPESEKEAKAQHVFATKTLQLEQEARRDYFRLHPDQRKYLRLQTSAQASAPSFDWRTFDRVTPVKDQGACGACWAFASNAALESSYLDRQSKAINPSVQDLLDCTRADYDCKGGNWAFSYMETRGTSDDAVYTYSQKKGLCRVGAARV